ncbi:hypothetical protein F4561_000655 [Lipingzhangella halophila]|uniref:CDP-Glycerol:Poly(Glycerophosphate) glycerophosphotransferase n=1 Tax=Lipingzhangella halophila TaxID=1783352 RepID=A0A7W7W1N0_9ACTN|nr:hypothetical protein [Lipingzhangella halophila]MBB4929835.1 hypothetical protein [Lipingzhangella halophila]
MTDSTPGTAPSPGDRDADERVSALDPDWTTVNASLRVLGVIHNVASATRLVDVLAALESDPRVQVFVTWTRSSIFSGGVADFLSDLGFPDISWTKARKTEFDLAVTTSLGGDLHELRAPILRLPHGMGYNKYLARKPETGNRKPETGNRKPETGNAKPVFGLSPEWLMHEGRLIPSAIVLSHTEQRERLARDCPEALPAALVAGDPCYDRLVASVVQRRRYRRAFGVRGDQSLLVVSSTWGEKALFGRHPRLVSQLLGELAADEYRVALVLHPNVWHDAGPGQVEAWTASARRSGLILVPPREGWRAALVAADAVIGDHGSTSYYAAALGRPVLLDDGGRDAVAPDSPIAALLRTAATLDPRRRAAPQLATAHAVSAETTKIASQWVTSEPGRSLTLLRRAMYDLMRAPEPDFPPVLATVPVPPATEPEPTALWTIVEWGGAAREVSVRRFPAAVLERPSPDDQTGMLVVRDDERDARMAALADVVCCPSSDLPCPEDEWAAEVLRDHPGAQVALAYAADRVRLVSRWRERAEITVRSAPHDLDPSLLASVLAERVLTGTAPERLADLSPLTITAGSTARVAFTSAAT